MRFRKRCASSSDKFIYKKPCKYIGSIAVSQSSIEDRQRFINEKFDEMRDVIKGLPVVVVITEEGLKVYNEFETVVKMAHGVTRVMFSTCQPERKLFSYVAKTRSSMGKNFIQAHLFKNKKSSHTKEFNASVSRAFSIANAKATLSRQKHEKIFESEAAESGVETKRKGKRWAKQEIARGHDFSAHAQLALLKKSNGNADSSEKGVEAFDEVKRTDGNQISSSSQNQAVVRNKNGNKSEVELLDRKSQLNSNVAVTIEVESSPMRQGIVPAIPSASDVLEGPLDGVLHKLTISNSPNEIPINTIQEKSSANEIVEPPIGYSKLLESTSKSSGEFVFELVKEIPSTESKVKNSPGTNEVILVVEPSKLDVNETDFVPISSHDNSCEYVNVKMTDDKVSLPKNEFRMMAERNGVDGESENFEEINQNIGNTNIIISEKENISTQNNFLKLDDNSVDGDVRVRKLSPANLVTPTQRFSTLENETQQLVDSPFEGYVNLIERKETVAKEEATFTEEIDNVCAVIDISQSEMSEEDIIRDAEWFQAGFSREIAESVLQDRTIGSFFVRNSMTHLGCFVMTVKLPTDIKATGYGNFLIVYENNEYHLKGFESSFKTLTDLVSHYASIQEDIPVQLHLVTENLVCKQHIDEFENDSDDEAYDDPDYQFFNSPDGMLKELENLST